MVLSKNYMTISEVAEKLGVTRQTVSRWLQGGKIEAEKVGREKLISKKSVTKYMQKQIDELIEKLEGIG